MKGELEFTKDLIEALEQTLAFLKGDLSGIGSIIYTSPTKKQKTEEDKDNER